MILFFYYIFEFQLSVAWMMVLTICYILFISLSYFGYFYKTYSMSCKINRTFKSDYPGILKELV